MRTTSSSAPKGARTPRPLAAWRAARPALVVLLLAVLSSLPSGCGRDDCDCHDPLVYAVTGAGDLIAFRTWDPGFLEISVPITGLQPAESIVAIDFRPSDGRLYGLGDSARLYTIDRGTGAATEVGVGPFGVLAGTSFGMDVNPVVDVIRVVSDAGENVRLNPDTGALVATDTALQYDAADPNFGTPPGVVAVAYTNAFDGATDTTLFGIDVDLDVAVLLGSLDGTPVSPNSGTLFTIGDLGVNAGAVAAMDVLHSRGTDSAYAVLTTPSSVSPLLFRIGLVTGHAFLVDAIGTNDLVTAMTIRP